MCRREISSRADTSRGVQPSAIGFATFAQIHCCLIDRLFVDIDKARSFSFVDATVSEDPAGAEVGTLPVDDEPCKPLAGESGEAAANGARVETELPDEGDALGEQILAVEIAEFRESAALDRALTERLHVPNVVQRQLALEHRAKR